MSGSGLQALGKATGIRGWTALDKSEMRMPHSEASARKPSYEESRQRQNCCIKKAVHSRNVILLVIIHSAFFLNPLQVVRSDYMSEEFPN